MSEIQWPELGTVGQQTRLYSDGEWYVHPSGNIYKRVNNRWEIVRPEIVKPKSLWERFRSWLFSGI